MQLTEWFSYRKKPAHIGVYERRVYSPDSGFASWRFAHWDGIKWSPARDTPEKAYDARRLMSGTKFAAWRGLAVKP